MLIDLPLAHTFKLYILLGYHVRIVWKHQVTTKSSGPHRRLWRCLAQKQDNQMAPSPEEIYTPED